MSEPRDDPFQEFGEWWAEEQVPIVLATASRDGRPTARTVVLEQHDERGFVFWTSAQSPKGQELAANPRAALVFLWERRRQVRVEGRVERVADKENEEHWRDREGKREIAAFEQSEPIESREALEALVARVPEDPPRPEFWVGYRVVPDAFEFWTAADDFVHDRFRYERANGRWSRTRLQP